MSRRGEVGATAVFEGLDMLAAIATQELHGGSEKEGRCGSEDGGERRGSSDGRGRGSVQPKKLAEMEVVTMEQIRSMSGNTLVKIFTETDFDEIKRIYSYSCLLIPNVCKMKFQSFGSESKAKKQIQKHLEKHVDILIKDGSSDFTAEPVSARSKRIKDNLPAPDVVWAQQRPAKRRIQVKQEPVLYLEKENSDVITTKRRKDEELKPLLSEISNEQTSKHQHRVKVKLEQIHPPEEAAQARTPPPQSTADLHRLKEEMCSNLKLEKGKGTEKTSIDEDHCYAQRSIRMKNESVWDEDESTDEDDQSVVSSNPSHSSTQSPTLSSNHSPNLLSNQTSILNSNHHMSVSPNYSSNQATSLSSNHLYNYSVDTAIASSEELAAIQAIESCEVVIDGANIQELSVILDQVVQEEVLVETEAEVADEEIVGVPENVEGVAELVEWVEDSDLLYYTEEVEDKQADNRKLKNKRTVAAVSPEDKMAALAAMEELRSRGATTEDLVCRLCSPPRPFTAYSTLLTHYRSHAGLRPFECSICQATFTRQHSLNYHLMTHANKTRFTCPYCTRKFRHPTHYKEHVKKHGEVVQFQCNICQTSVSSQSHFRKHLKSKHNKTIDIMGNIIDWPQDGKERVYRKKKRVRGEGKKKKQPEEEVEDLEEVEEMIVANTAEMFEEVQMVNTSKGPVLYQTGDIYASDNGKFYQVDKGQLYGGESSQPSSVVLESPAPVNPQVETSSPMIFVVPNSGKSEEYQVCNQQISYKLASQPGQPAYQTNYQVAGGSGSDIGHRTAHAGQQTTESYPPVTEVTSGHSEVNRVQSRVTVNTGVQIVSSSKEPASSNTPANQMSHISNSANQTAPVYNEANQINPRTNSTNLSIVSCSLPTNHKQLSQVAGSQVSFDPASIHTPPISAVGRYPQQQTSATDGYQPPLVYSTNPPPLSATDRRKLSLEEVIERELQDQKRPHTGQTVITQPPTMKISILERALTDVFPASNGTNVQTNHVDEKARAGNSVDDRSSSLDDRSDSLDDRGNFGFPGNYNFKEQVVGSGDPLYNPNKSPLKNRNEVLCDILGISG